MDSPLVTVCVASYNNSKFIIDTLNSIKNQTYKNIELIIVDDSSIDDSVDVINNWIQSNSAFNVVFTKNEVNLGICKTFNKAVKASKGQYISIIGSDDLLLPKKIERQVHAFESLGETYGAIYTDVYKIKADGERWFSRFIQTYRQFIDVPQGDLFMTLLNGNYIPIMSVLWRSSCFQECGFFDEDLAYEDYDMLLRISKKYKIGYEDYMSAEYRIHENNFSHKSRSLRYLETDFKIYAKHIGVSDESDAIIKGKMERIIIEMSLQDAPNVKELFRVYSNYFNGFSTMKFALKTRLDFKKILKITRALDALRA